MAYEIVPLRRLEDIEGRRLIGPENILKCMKCSEGKYINSEYKCSKCINAIKILTVFEISNGSDVY